MDQKFIIISLEGNVGAGKSTLFNLIQKTFPDAYYLREPLEAWQAINNNPELNILEKYYTDINRWAFTFQIYAYQSRLMSWDKQLKQLEEQMSASNQDFQSPQKKQSEVKLVFTERSIESAREIFFKTCFKQQFLSELEYHIYEEFYAWLMEHFKKYQISSLIYVRTPAEECLNRLKRRGRDEEVTVSLDYLKQLENQHDNWVQSSKKNMNVIEIDATENYLSDEAIQGRVISQIKKHVYDLIIDQE